MPDDRFERNLQPSLLDRLLDLEPDTRFEAPITRAESLRRFKASVKRDLEWLLNTVRPPLDVPDAYRDVKKSVLTFGLPDISSFSLQSGADEQRLLRSIEEAIVTYEPRLKRVRVSNPQTVTSSQQTIVFHVEALLMMDPAPEPIVFDTVLEVGKGEYTVKEG